MSWRYHGRAIVNPDRPSAFGVCDRCARWYNLDELMWQYDWRGPRLENLRILVCSPCNDTPQEQLRPIVLPPDPLPRVNPRPEPFTSDDAGTISAAGGAVPPNFGPPILSD